MVHGSEMRDGWPQRHRAAVAIIAGIIIAGLSAVLMNGYAPGADPCIARVAQGRIGV